MANVTVNIQPQQATIGIVTRTNISGLRTALNGLANDIFALCVRYAVASHLPEDTKGVPRSFLHGRRRKILWLFMAVLFTFGLQMMLVALLWRAASTGMITTAQPESKMLWQQVGYMHQLLCRANHSDLLQDVLKTPSKDCNCSAWWPSTGGRSWTIPYDEVFDCLSQAPSNMSRTASCTMVSSTMDPLLVSYARGLFTDFYQTPDNGSVQFIMEEWDPEQRMDHVFFMVLAYMSMAIVVHTEFKQGVWLCYIAAGAVGILPSFYGRRARVCAGNNSWRIVGHAALAHRMHWINRVIVLLVPMLQLLSSLAVLATVGVLYLYGSQQKDPVTIITNSVALAFILEMDNKIGHILNLREDRQFPKVTWFKEAAPTKPPPGRASQVWARFSNMINNMQGRHTALQRLFGYASQRQNGSPGEGTVPKAGNAQAGGPPVPRTVKPVGTALGHLYMSLVGVLMYAEVCFLAPQAAAQMLSFVVVRFMMGDTPDGGAWAGGGTGLVPQLFREIQFSDWFENNLWTFWSFGGFLDGFWGAQGATIIGFAPPGTPHAAQWITAAMILYGLCTILFVGLLCARMLPSSNIKWTMWVVVTQALLAVLVQLQDSTFKPQCNPENPDFAFAMSNGTQANGPDSSIYMSQLRKNCPRNFWWVVVVSVYALFWFVMFVAWPLQSSWWPGMVSTYRWLAARVALAATKVKDLIVAAPVAPAEPTAGTSGAAA